MGCSDISLNRWLVARETLSTATYSKIQYRVGEIISFLLVLPISVLITYWRIKFTTTNGNLGTRSSSLVLALQMDREAELSQKLFTNTACKFISMAPTRPVLHTPHNSFSLHKKVHWFQQDLQRNKAGLNRKRVEDTGFPTNTEYIFKKRQQRIHGLHVPHYPAGSLKGRVDGPPTLHPHQSSFALQSKGQRKDMSLQGWR